MGFIKNIVGIVIPNKILFTSVKMIINEIKMTIIENEEDKNNKDLERKKLLRKIEIRLKRVKDLHFKNRLLKQYKIKI
ncbi:MAG: hypothetical protein ACTSVK_06175 [Promethearchaeota archaeon]